jgi:hypothetical protein
MTSSALRRSDPAKRHSERLSLFLRMTGGVSYVRYWGVSAEFAFSPQWRSSARIAAGDEPMARERVARLTQAAARPGGCVGLTRGKDATGRSGGRLRPGQREAFR